MRNLFLLFLFYLVAYSLSAQIVNIEERRKAREEGFKGNVSLNFSFTKNTVEVLDLDNLIQLSYKKKRNLYLFINELEVIRNANSDVLNNGFQHFRYNYRLSELLLMEAFLQHQFNQIQRIDRRVLVGVGPRFEIIRKDSLSLNMGSQIMREFEKNSSTDYSDDYRLSTYLSVDWQINKELNFTSTIYYQPNLEEFNDRRISNKSVLSMAVSNKLRLRLIYELLQDSRVPEDVPETVYSLETGLGYIF